MSSTRRSRGAPRPHDPPSDPPASGRRPSFATIFREHSSAVASAVRLFGVPARDSEDVAQDVFVEAHASLHRYDPRRPLLPWLMTIAARRAMDARRSAYHRRVELARTEGETLDAIDPSPSPERQAHLHQAQDIAIELLQELDEEQRAVFVMADVHGIAVKDIAAELGLPDNTVWSRLHRARQAFYAAAERRRLAEERKVGAAFPMLAPAALVEAARNLPGLDAAAQARAWARLVRILGLGIIGALAPLSTLQIVGGLLLVFSLGAGAGAAVHASAHPEATATATAAREELFPARAAGPTPSTTVTASAAPSASAAPVPATATAATSAPMRDAIDHEAEKAARDLRAESSLVDRARNALRTGKPDAALVLLDQHAALYPNGQLKRTRESLKEEALAEKAKAKQDGGTR